MKKLNLTLTLLALALMAKAQTTDRMVGGTVTDAATGQPLAGVYVEAYGNNRYTAMTDENGHYEMKVPEHVTSLSMRFDG